MISLRSSSKKSPGNSAPNGPVAPRRRHAGRRQRVREGTERVAPPRREVGGGHHLGDRQRRDRRDLAVLDGGPHRRAGEQRPQPGDRRLGLCELAFHPPQVRRDLAVPRLQVGGDEHRPDRVKRHAQVAQPPDDLGGNHLGRVVGAVAGERVDGGGLQDAHVVVVPERLHAQVGHPGELADRQQRCHGLSISPPCGRAGRAGRRASRLSASTATTSSRPPSCATDAPNATRYPWPSSP